ncbi:hypothetical protein [Paraburkholderia sp. GAS334]|uniref:hypothetical protein n=1 Tax=Paraburkholderia sp. GAS334 TaxID=3035131 RepID=UPI003D1EF2FC
MIKFAARALIAVAAIGSFQFSGQLDHVDVSVSAACVAGISAQVEPSSNSCTYRDVTRRGRVFERDFEIFGALGGGLYSSDARVVSRSNQTGLTWRSLALLLIAVAVWIPALLPLFGKRREHAGAH